MRNREKKWQQAAAPVVMMNFTHVYEQEYFYRKEPHLWMDFTGLKGVNGYCDEEAGREIRERIEDLSPMGVHFIDSGNFHYISKFWTDKIREVLCWFCLIIIQICSRPASGSCCPAVPG